MGYAEFLLKHLLQKGEPSTAPLNAKDASDDHHNNNNLNGASDSNQKERVTTASNTHPLCIYGCL
jgi:hypothetical protein